MGGNDFELLVGLFVTSKSLESMRVVREERERKKIKKNVYLLFASIPKSHGATVSFSLADFSMVSGSGNECLTMAP